MKYIVKTGDIKIRIEAKTHKMAVILAINNAFPGGLGVLTSCKKVGDKADDTVYFKTENVLIDMGFQLEK